MLEVIKKSKICAFCIYWEDKNNDSIIKIDEKKWKIKEGCKKCIIKKLIIFSNQSCKSFKYKI